MQIQLACISHLLLLAVLMGHSLAVFYTKSKDTDYPRIGRRSFYTTGSDNHYPRIGRRASGGVDSTHINPRLLLLAGSPEAASSAASSSSGTASSSAFSELSKRGIFTQGGNDLPRVGRRSDGPGAGLDYFNARRQQLFQRLAELKDNSMEADPSSEEEGQIDSSESASSIPLEIMFMAFDDNGDGKLSKDEFALGMRKYRQQNPLC
ncbi:pleurin [Elysia marginata]|uniref:Pleurin n=1 Tax=Elysia marginata TaxID=1093978 RepID=A0AAV4J1J6_9GAST|nr:pleurin [Elysia marginata]